MKIMILTASTGAGHNQAARNIANEFLKLGNDEIEIFDFFMDTSKRANEFVTKSYDTFANKFPNTYGFIYNISNRKLINDIFMKNLFFKVKDRVKKKILEDNPAVIVSTHPMSVPLIMKIFEEENITIPFVQIVTDFKAHYIYVDKGVTAYITGSEYTKENLIKCGVSSDKIFVYGIPIRDEFKTVNKSETETFNILLMGGSMGLKKMEDSVDVLLNSDLNVKITIICGNNTELRGKLVKKFKDKIISGKTEIKGFVNNIDELMDKSKLIITKPGGLTSTEAINKQIPMIIPFSIPGQEEENAAFLVEEKMAISINDIDDLPKYVKMLLENKELYNEIVDNMRKLSESYSVEKIVDLVHNLKNN
ncbi:MGDG synthase family glycosyltransferase [Caviibacter abscessus]|uniref:MGDG synthase family glycosyltransferase n=1 Tax=Caviibacter abscessus TaxID=1766719 RepID=UPI000837F2A8|nr:glycosyltransferase [Caviibacter abscessus]